MTIHTEILRSVTKIITHADCADGRASALILHEALPNAAVFELAYGSPEYEGLAAEPGMLFCDITPPRARVAEFVAAGAIVLDHHKGAEDIVRAFGERGVFADEKLEPGVSGAYLAFREVWRCLQAERRDAGRRDRWIMRFAFFVGIRDTWQRSDPKWDLACELCEALRFVPLANLLELGIDGSAALAERLGPILLDKKQAEARKLAENAVRLNVSGLRVAIIADYDATDDVIDVLGDSVDLLAGFAYVAENDGSVKLCVSLRSRGDVDAMKIAKTYGGGGHTKAAGFSLRVACAGPALEQPSWNPYDVIRMAIRHADA